MLSRCGGVVNNQIKNGLLLSRSVKTFLIGKYLANIPARTWLSRAVCALATALLKDEVHRHIKVILVARTSSARWPAALRA